MRTKNSKIYFEKVKSYVTNFDLKTINKKITAIFAIVMLLMQYTVIPTYAYREYSSTLTENSSMVKGDFESADCPYNIEFTKLVNLDCKYDAKNSNPYKGGKLNGIVAIDNMGNLWTWGAQQAYNKSLNEVYNTWITTPKKIISEKIETSKIKDISGNMTIDKDDKLWLWADGYISGNINDSDLNIYKVGGDRNFSKVAGTVDEYLAIDRARNLYVYGNNENYQLGTGNTNKVTTITPIMRGYTFKDIGISSFFGAAIDTSGNIWSWGTNLDQWSPYGNKKVNREPVKISENINFESISVGDYHALAIDENKNLYSWGCSENGMLGNGNSQSSIISNPIKIMEGTKFEKISAGDGFSLAIDENGNLYAWGYNQEGLGNGSKQSYVPIQIKSGTKFKEIKTSNSGTAMAIDIDGNLWAWGQNFTYTFGDGTHEHSSLPIQITAPNESFTVNFYNEDGTILLDTQNVRAGSEATTSIIPTKESTVEHSYTFEKWVAMDGSDIDLSNITEDTNVKAKFREDTKSYNVKFKNDDGSILNEQTVNYGSKATYEGTTPTKSRYGYTCIFKGWDKDLENTIITEDTVFTAQYDENISTYTIMYNNIDGASFITENPSTYNVETEDFTLCNPTAAGYTFQGWEGTDIDGVQNSVTVHRGSTGNRTYKAIWTAKEDTKYKVEHYKQKADGTYSSEPDETENKTGVTQSIVTATIKKYPGYTEDTDNSNRLVSGKIAGDGSLVLRVYYKANPDTSYRVEHYLQNLDNTNYTIDNNATEHKKGVTGRQTTAKAKTYDGFIAQSFSQEIIAGDGSTVVRIYYNRNRDTVYKVEHYKQKADGTYPETASETENKTGITGDIVSATAKTYAGYTEDISNTDRITTGTISGDGSLVLKLYYKANTNTSYKIEHYKQKANGTYGSVADEIEDKTGITGAMATAEAKTYAGYTEDKTNGNRIVSGTIYGDGSLVLKLYYKITEDSTKHIVVTPGEDEEGKKNIEISSTSPKEIDKVTVNGKEVEKDENGKYIYYPNKNGEYEIEVTYKDGTTEKVTYEETRLSNKNNTNNNKGSTNTNSNKNQTSGTKNDNTLATKILSKTGRTYMGIIMISIVTIMSIIVITRKYIVQQKEKK